jgi:hypothetical protein
MKFKNNGATQKVRIGDNISATWKTVKSGEIVDLPKEIGIAYKFQAVAEEKVEVKESKPAKKKK